jgi:hypothetical protein
MTFSRGSLERLEPDVGAEHPGHLSGHGVIDGVGPQPQAAVYRVD